MNYRKIIGWICVSPLIVFFLFSIVLLFYVPWPLLSVTIALLVVYVMIAVGIYLLLKEYI